MLAFWPNIAVFFAAFILSAAIAMAGWSGRLSIAASPKRVAVQSFHLGQTPRLGGIAIITSTVMAAILFFPDEFWNGHIFIFICCMPALILALREDCGFSVTPNLRLVSCFLSSLIYLIFTGDLLPRVGIGFFDEIIRNTILGLIISTLFVTAAVQSMNLIDGLNGLCSGIGFLISVCLAAVAEFSNSAELFYVSTISAAAILGFFVVNYPAGGLFLGDSGAYWIGFSLSFLGIHFLRQIPDFSAPAILLIFFWPAFDIFLAIWRRFYLRRRLFQPDRMHPHHIAVRLLRVRFVGADRRLVANSFAAFLILLLAAPPMMLGVAFWNSQGAAWGALLFCIVTYPAFYVFTVRAARRDLIKRGARRARRSSAEAPSAGYAIFGRGATSMLRAQASDRIEEPFVNKSRPSAIAHNEGTSIASEYLEGNYSDEKKKGNFCTINK